MTDAERIRKLATLVRQLADNFQALGHPETARKAHQYLEAVLIDTSDPGADEAVRAAMGYPSEPARKPFDDYSDEPD